MTAIATPRDGWIGSKADAVFRRANMTSRSVAIEIGIDPRMMQRYVKDDLFPKREIRLKIAEHLRRCGVIFDRTHIGLPKVVVSTMRGR